MCKIKKLLEKLRIDELNKYQKQVIAKRYYEKTNHVISLPMGSGKSILAYIKFLDNSGVHQYIAPTRAIANQKYNELSEIFDNVLLMMGGIHRREDVTPSISVITPEKLMSELINEKTSVDDIGTVIVDEAHIITDRSRGQEIELLITTLNKYTNKTQLAGTEIVLMSGTMYNHRELGMWIGGRVYHIPEEEEQKKHYIADVRPRGIILEDTESDDEIYMLNDTGYAVTSVVKHYYEKTDKRLLVACATKGILKNYYDEIVKITGVKGIFMHHRDLQKDHLKMVEQKISGYDYRVVFSTTTLAMGVDFTFDTVILTFDRLHDDIYDWKKDWKEQEIDNYMILTLQQISRRSGHKPGMTSEAVTVGKTAEDSIRIYENAYEKNPPVTSRLNLMKGLMMLQKWFVYLIALGLVKTVADLLDFVNSTFFISNGGDLAVLEPAIRDFLHNPWVGLSGDKMNLRKLSIDEILEYDLIHKHVKIKVCECLVNLAKKGWSPGLLIYFIRDTFEDFRSFTIEDEEILKYLIRPDLELVVDMRKLSGYSRTIYTNRYQAFFESLKMVDRLLDDSYFGTPYKKGRPQNPDIDKAIYGRIKDLVELTNDCMQEKIINTFVDEGDKKSRMINEFKSDSRTWLIIRVKLDELYQKLRRD